MYVTACATNVRCITCALPRYSLIDLLVHHRRLGRAHKLLSRRLCQQRLLLSGRLPLAALLALLLCCLGGYRSCYRYGRRWLVDKGKGPKGKV